jgi:hypothetical protein
MHAATRIVRRLRLRATSAPASRRALVLVEDAMRTASLPDTGGRIVLVRRLELGRVDPRAPPQAVALALEREIARLRPAIEYADADRPRAGAVWFRDALDAHTRLAQRLAAGDPVDAWYWRLAVRAWRPRSRPREALRDIALSLAALPEAPTALPRWTAALCAAGQREALVAALQPDDVGVLMRAAGLRAPVPGSAPAPPEQTDDIGSHLPRVRTSASSRDDRARSPAWRDDPRRALLRAFLRMAGVRSVDALEPGRNGSPGDAATGPVAAPTPRARAHAEEPAVRAPPVPRRSPRSTVRHDACHADRRAPFATRPDGVPAMGHAPSFVGERRVPDAAATVAGGLLFLVPVLVHLGYADWLAEHPVWDRGDVARRVLGQALARLDVPPDDTAWLLAAADADVRTAPRRFVAPSDWRGELSTGTGPALVGGGEGGSYALWDPSGRLLLGAWRGACPRPLLALRRRAAETGAGVPDDFVAAAAGAWLVALRRWLRRRARIGLADLVLRPATLALTPTHADLHFDLAHADLRVRRAGLDIDPGWVPWLGRVITIHYER